jgi:DNA-binding transcriptional ArsR family regulator
MFSVMDELQHRLSVIAEPNRFRIVELLRSGPRSVGAIVDALGLAQPHVSRHLKLLADAGVVDATRQAQLRIYRLRPEPLREIGAWAQSFAVLWTERLDRLGDFLDEPNGDRS